MPDGKIADATYVWLGNDSANGDGGHLLRDPIELGWWTLYTLQIKDLN